MYDAELLVEKFEPSDKAFAKSSGALPVLIRYMK
jgi:hypothetical protein